MLDQFLERPRVTKLLVAPASTEVSNFFRPLPYARGLRCRSWDSGGWLTMEREVLVVFAEREGSVAAAGYCCAARLSMARLPECATAGFGSMSICGSAVRCGDCPLASLISEQLAGFFHAL